MSLAPAIVVDQPTLVPPPISLVNSAVDATPDGERWVNGFRYSPEACTGGQAFPLNCVPSETKLVVAASDPITGTPYGIYAQDTCSTFSYQWRDYVARATRLLLAVESEWIAAELWTPAYEPNNIGFTNAPNIIDATGASPAALTTAIGIIESQFIQCDETTLPMIHMTPLVFEQILGVTGAGNLFIKEGNRWYTAFGSQVVIDKGYIGSGPGGVQPTDAAEWIWATAPVQVRRSPIFAIPTEMSEATLRRENQVTYRAERAVHASFNYNCCAVALNVARTFV